MVTHDPVAASYADRVLFLADGNLAGELVAPDPKAVADRMVALTARGAVAGAAGLPGAPGGLAAGDGRGARGRAA
jgi:putative ABC transport system ATP-binding protein